MPDCQPLKTYEIIQTNYVGIYHAWRQYYIKIEQSEFHEQYFHCSPVNYPCMKSLSSLHNVYFLKSSRVCTSAPPVI